MPKANVIASITGRLRGFQAPAASARTNRLVTTKADLNAQITKLKAELDRVNDKLLRAVKAEGEEDAEGKVRLETEEAKLQVISAKNRRIDDKTLLALGVKPSIIEKATIETPYEYVGVYPKTEKKGAK